MYIDGEKLGIELIDVYMVYMVEMVCWYFDCFIGCFVYNLCCGVENGVNVIDYYVCKFGFKMV